MQAREIRQFLVDVLVKKGMYAFEAEVVAERLLDAEALGIPAAGCVRLPGYVRSIDVGDIDPRAILQVKQEKAATSFLNANEGMGQLAATKGVELAVKKGRESGIGLVVIANSQSLASPFIYARLIAQQGLIGICLTSTAEKFVPPESLTQPYLGSQPSAFAVPAAGKTLGFEFSFTSQLATTILLPSELSAAFGLLHALLTCGLTGERIPNQKTRGPLLERTEHVLAAVDPAAFVGLARFEEKLTDLQDYFASQNRPLLSDVLTDEADFELAPETLAALQAIATKEKIEWHWG